MLSAEVSFIQVFISPSCTLLYGLFSLMNSRFVFTLLCLTLALDSNIYTLLTSSPSPQVPCIQRYIHTYIHTYIPTYIRTYIHTYIHICIYCIYIHIPIHTHIYIYIHTYIETMQTHRLIFDFFFLILKTLFYKSK